MKTIPTSYRIPPELVYDIFSHLSSSPLQVHKAHEFPWYLGQICSEWRSIFRSMLPYFWNEIEIEWREDHDEEDEYKHVATMLEFFLDTIRGAPFSFTLWIFSRDDGRKNASSTQLILGKLLDHSEQWEEASMELNDLEFTMIHRLKNRLPLLRALRLYLSRNRRPENDEDTSLFPPGDVFTSAPLLAQISLDNFSFLWGFNWSSLTSINLSFITCTSTLTSALRQSINLEELTFGDEFSEEELVGTKIIKLPRLRYLFLEGVYLLPHLETPALKELVIGFQLEEDYNTDSPELALADSDEWHITTAFIVRSKCMISMFSATLIGSMALGEILQSMPDIEHLLLTTIKGWTKVFEWLSGADPGAHTTQPREPPLRRLNELTVSFWDDEDIDLGELHNMVAHRTAGPNNLGPKILHIEPLY